MSVYITGDIHGDPLSLIEFSRKNNLTAEDVIVILGDVGINILGDRSDVYMKDLMSSVPNIFFCVHGNHENRPQNIPSYHIEQWRGGRVMVEDDYPNLLFPVDGDIFDLVGNQCIVIGGAYSVDKFYRLRHNYPWWSDEQPSEEIKAYVEQQIKNRPVDIVFSHTCPHRYEPVEAFLSNIDQRTIDKSTELWLDKVESSLSYKRWYCGHWHINKLIDKIYFLFHDIKELR